MDVPSIPGYDVLGRLGAGATSTVWRARRVADDLPVALKVVRTGPERVAGALREAGVLAAVRHEHVIRLYDVLPVPGSAGRPDGVALAMELAEGGSLAEVIGARDHLTPGELVTVCSPLAGALAELHRAGVVHGDISPGNVLFHGDGMPLLADLGVSRVAGERRAEVHGTDGMVAPEVLEGFDPTSDSDVYAVGALAWRALVGEVPGWVGTRAELAELRPELPAELVSVITACLSGEPADRPTAQEVALALFAAAKPEPVALAPGADPAAGLTQRIRADVRGAGVEAHPRALRAGDTRAGANKAEATKAGAARSGRARSLAGWGRQLRRRGVVVTLGVAGAVVVVALAVAGWLGAMSPAPTEQAAGDPARGSLAAVAAEAAETSATGDDRLPVTPAEETGQASAREAGSAQEPGSAAEPGSAREPGSSHEPETAAEPTPASERAVTFPEDPVAPAQELLDARAAAWRSGDPADLATVHVAGSPALDQETEALVAAADLQVAYRGLAFTVADAQVLAAGPERAVLQVEVQRSAYQEVSPAGEVTHESRSDVIELELRRSDGAWLIWGWN